MKEKNPLYLVDISSFIFRAFFAIRSLSNPKGVPTNAVYGVATMLEKLIEKTRPKEGGKPRHLIVVYDSKESTFREEMYEDYKANRSEPPDDLVPQFDLIDQLIRLMGLHSYRQPGFEADDLIATLTKRWQAEGEDHEVIVVTGDKDLMQLVNDRVEVWDTMNDKRYKAPEVEEKFGLPPGLIRDYLSMVGDSVDNVPGIAGVGPKTAVQLLKEFGDLEGVLAAAKAGKIPGKKGETIAASADIARLSRKLVTLKDDIELDLDPDDCRFEWKVTPELLAFLNEMNFKTLHSKWSAKGAGTESAAPASENIASVAEVSVSSVAVERTASPKDVSFTLLNDEKEFLKYIEKVRKQKRFAFDVETTSLNPREAQLVGISLAVDASGGVYVPVGHSLPTKPQLNVDFVLERLKPLLEDPSVRKIGQNLKYDYSVMRSYGIAPQGVEADTMVASYVLDAIGSHGMDALSRRYLDYQPMAYEDLCGKGKNQIGFDQVDIDAACRYSAEDAWVTWRLWETFEPELEKQKLMDVFLKIDNPLVEVLTRMECEGVSIDRPFLKELSMRFEREMMKIDERIQSYAPQPVNLNSPKQLGPFLFEHLKLPPQGKTKTGYSTDAETLEAISPLHEVPRLLLEYREISKLKGTYVDPLPTMVDVKTGKIHAHFHQAVTATGRLSSSDPNLQNIPIRSERGKLIRRAFVASKGRSLISADYSQIELRILAHMSGDPELCGSFQREEDVHRRTASEIYHVKLEAVTDEQRAVAKAINFGLMYGKTAFGLASELKISRTEAKDMIDRYFKRYQGVKGLLDRLVQEAHETGEVKTLFGRVRKLPDIHAKNPMVRANAERMAMNSPIQGTAADLMKLAMIDLDRKILERGLKGRMTIQVHDELILDVPQEEVEAMSALVTECMEGAMKLNVPLKVNLGVAQNWNEA